MLISGWVCAAATRCSSVSCSSNSSNGPRSWSIFSRISDAFVIAGSLLIFLAVVVVSSVGGSAGPQFAEIGDVVVQRSWANSEQLGDRGHAVLRIRE